LRRFIKRTKALAHVAIHAWTPKAKPGRREGAEDRAYGVFQKNAGNPRGGIGLGTATAKGSDIMTKENPHIGSTFESWLDEQGIREEVTAAAIKEMIAGQLATAMKEQGITKVEMAARMKTSRAQVDRLLDPENSGATLDTLMRAAKVVGRRLRLELV
jgi:antitoxin HicB